MPLKDELKLVDDFVSKGEYTEAYTKVSQLESVYGATPILEVLRGLLVQLRAGATSRPLTESRDIFLKVLDTCPDYVPAMVELQTWYEINGDKAEADKYLSMAQQYAVNNLMAVSDRTVKMIPIDSPGDVKDILDRVFSTISLDDKPDKSEDASDIKDEADTNVHTQPGCVIGGIGDDGALPSVKDVQDALKAPKKKGPWSR